MRLSNRLAKGKGIQFNLDAVDAFLEMLKMNMNFSDKNAESICSASSPLCVSLFQVFIYQQGDVNNVIFGIKTII